MSYREFSDRDGRAWRMWDTYPQSARRGAFPDAYSRGWLTFECDLEKRRLVPVPVDWALGTDEELGALLAEAFVVPIRSATQ
jgi:hypothetical protein